MASTKIQKKNCWQNSLALSLLLRCTSRYKDLAYVLEDKAEIKQAYA